ncbi:DNA alkylation repair protein [Salisediminibacterium selenitireducens]|uniref:DNA alkylation repair enzyme n=1 Tax=Bacillus selenitireducens (strain ATCC 700615 / DSM 15326 / MLS10) TaxID=439292 RepID=D6XXV2_BACIE|nr:DNA alkylation repair protein [Salisediminibacterium selenitireducens]ADI00145.1 DNA alkylation repair enzyme [[Bacillus] selenitireducens MLS10]
MNLTELTNAFEQVKDPHKAEKMAAYMKNQFPFFGVQATERRQITGPLFTSWQVTKKPVDWGFIHELWMMPEREYQYVAMDLLKRMEKKLGPGDLEELKTLIGTKSWWDTVDGLASGPVGRIVKAYPEAVDVMDAWVTDEDLWVRRTAILHQLSYKADTDEDRLLTYCRRHAEDPAFFIAKAIGWALREYGKTNPEAVRDFVHATPLRPLSRREALKHIGSESEA